MSDSSPSSNNLERWAITVTVMLVAIVEVLDMTIVNVALPHMMGSLGASSDQITWVLTSYIVSAAIFMPLTGFFVNRLGRKRILLINIAGFLAASVLCGLTTTLTGMVFFRVLQGIFGAALVPLSQYILRDTYPVERHGQAMAIWGIGIMAAPVLGPTLGGYITDALNWRWIFYINVPVCLLAFFMAVRFIKDTPIVREKIDYFGIVLLALGIGCLQIFLDRGNSVDWFNSASIAILGIAWLITLSLFIVRGWRKPDNIINLHLFRDRNFSLATSLIILYTFGVLGVISLQPILLESMMGYTPAAAGLIMAPRGIASAVAMILISRAVDKFDARWLITAGLVITAFGTYLLTELTLTASQAFMMYAGAIQGFGMGLFFVPLSTIGFATLPKNAIAEASGLFSFGRSLGSSIGISALSALLTRESQINWNQLGSHLSIYNHNLSMWLTHSNMNLDNPLTLHQLSNQLYHQAGIIAFIDMFWLISLSFALMIPLVFMMRNHVNRKILLRNA